MQNHHTHAATRACNAYNWLLPFTAGMLAGAALLVLTASAPDGLFMVAVNLGIIGLGMLMGGLGFG